MRIGSSAAIAALLLFVSGCGGSGKPAPGPPPTTTHSGTTTIGPPPISGKRAFLAVGNLACRSVAGKPLTPPRKARSRAALRAYAAGAVAETKRALTLLEQVAAGRGEQSLVTPLLADYATLLQDYETVESSGNAAGLLRRIAAEQTQGSNDAGSIGLPLCAPALL